MLRRGAAPAQQPAAKKRRLGAAPRRGPAPSAASSGSSYRRVSQAQAAQERRQRAARIQSETTPPAGKTLLQSVSVAAGQRKLYEGLMAMVMGWVAFWGLKPEGEAAWDRLLTKIMDVMFLDGEAPARGEKLLAAVLWYHPSLSMDGGGRMALTRQALRGWRKVMPSVGRLAAIAMLVNYFYLTGRSAIGILTLLAVELYSRPSEPFRLRCQDVVLPSASAAPLEKTAIVLHPWECGVPSKTQEFDETLLLDLPRHGGLTEALRALKAGRRGDQPLFQFSPGDLNAALSGAEAKLQLGVLGLLHAYRLRHSGATHNFATGARTLEAIGRRGRWRGMRSLRRYDKGGRVNELFSRLPRHVQTHALSCAQGLDGLLRGRLSASPVPW